MKITIIAKSPQKESYSEDNAFWYKEYAIGQIEKGNELDYFVKEFGARELWGFYIPHVSMSRRVDIINGITSFRDWSYYWFCEGEYKAVYSIIGDMMNNNAIGLTPLFDEVYNHTVKENELKEELKQLWDKITPYKLSRYSPLQQEFLGKWESELKERKLWKKVQSNKAPQDIIDEIKGRLEKEFQTESSRINNRMDEIKQQLEEMEELTK